MLKSIAQPKLATSNPGMILLTSNIIKPFTIKVNKPRVRMFNGSVNSKTIGLIKVLTIPRTIETTTAVTKLSTITPDNR